MEQQKKEEEERQRKEEAKNKLEIELRALPVSKLKELMAQHKVDFSGCLEKSEMVRLCAEHNLSPSSLQDSVPTPPTPSPGKLDIQFY